jgi:uncharacterized protein YgbK (DUF1537 family)
MSAPPDVLDKATALNALPVPWPTASLEAFRHILLSDPRKVFVLDDDPTGTQTVYDVPVLSTWSTETLRTELEAAGRVCYLLTNTRSLPADDARRINAEVGRNLRRAAARAKRTFVVLSRGDSTLRGHYPDELEALAHALGATAWPTLLIPYFGDGGRVTIDDTHYLTQGERLVPVSRTEFASDPVFGYRNSNLRAWVEEKTRGRILAREVASLSIEELRLGGPEAVRNQLIALPPGSVAVVNAASDTDVEVFVLGLLLAEAQGASFLCRTAASFVRVRAGLPAKPLLKPEELGLSGDAGGLIVAGSHVSTTTAQLEVLSERTGVVRLEVEVSKLLSDSDREGEIRRVAQHAERELERGEDVLIFTSRRLLTTGGPGWANQQISQSVSRALVEVVSRLGVRPRYVLCKGGITAHDVAKYALGAERARVLGQLAPGVPVWRLGPGSRFPGLIYIVFPGNVGEPRTLADVVRRLVRSPTP